MAKFRYLFTSILFLLHSLRNLYQHVGKTNIFTNFGGEKIHLLCIKLSNFAFKPFNYTYQASHEIYYFYAELIVAMIIFACFTIASKKNKYLRQVTTFIDEHYYKFLILFDN